VFRLALAGASSCVTAQALSYASVTATRKIPCPSRGRIRTGSPNLFTGLEVTDHSPHRTSGGPFDALLVDASPLALGKFLIGAGDEALHGAGLAGADMLAVFRAIERRTAAIA
jgi:hypothetical protein